VHGGERPLVPITDITEKIADLARYPSPLYLVIAFTAEKD
jgi:hypothetical protein